MFKGVKCSNTICKAILPQSRAKEGSPKRSHLAAIAVHCSIVLLLAAAFASCSSEDVSIEDKQSTDITSYLTSKSIEYNTKEGVFIHIKNAERENRESQAVLKSGDSVYLDFAIWKFSGGISQLYYTNIEEIVQSDESIKDQAASLAWDFETKGVKLGTTPMIKGVRIGIEGCFEGDSVQLYIPSGLAYGSGYVGVIAPNTPVVWDLIIKKIK